MKCHEFFWTTEISQQHTETTTHKINYFYIKHTAKNTTHGHNIRHTYSNLQHIFFLKKKNTLEFHFNFFLRDKNCAYVQAFGLSNLFNFPCGATKIILSNFWWISHTISNRVDTNEITNDDLKVITI